VTDADVRVRELVEEHRHERGALMPILHAVQAEYGCIDAAVIPVIAESLNISRADVHGVVSFYRDFSAAPLKGTTVRVCRAEACQSVGADALLDHARVSLGVEVGESTRDEAVTLEQVFCLGNCALGPSVQVGSRLFGRVDAERFDALVSGVGRS
jgi:formate dehydrogenase subunit gamma